MGRTKPVIQQKKSKRNPFDPTEEEQARWMRLPKVQEKCKALWMRALVTDAALEKLCLLPDGEFKYDPIAMTIACIMDSDRFSQAENPVWKAAYHAGRAQLKFTRYMEHASKKHKLSMFSIRKTCDVLQLK